MQFKNTIRNCPIKMKFKCPREWESLAVTDKEGVRHCDQCDEDVYFCPTDEETLRHARAGRCIARAEPAGRPRVVVGRPQKIEETSDEKLTRELRRREHGINWLVDGRLGYVSRDCLACGYPVPAFLSTCKVCGAASLSG